MTPEDEAFDELAKRQGMWGGGFMAKRAMAADKQREWIGLTEEEFQSMYDKFAKYQEYGAFVSGWEDFSKAIEAKLKEKNS
jgi:hypothetical protein